METVNISGRKFNINEFKKILARMIKEKSKTCDQVYHHMYDQKEIIDFMISQGYKPIHNNTQCDCEQ